MRDFAAPPTVVDFLGECAFDLQAGQLRPLVEYLRRFPGHVDAVVREYLTLVDAGAGPSDGATQQRIGQFDLVRELGRGGQGRVHLARDSVLGRFVALKVLLANGPTEATRRDRFRREVAALLRLDHPHVCRLFAADVDHDPPFAAMELVAGHSLAQLLALGERATAASAGVVRPRSARERQTHLRFFALVARALDAVHGAGILHRDLKPANVMLTARTEPRVLDFGLATIEATPSGANREDRHGTLAYMAPEQLQASGTVDRRTDVFALGLTLAECATGRHPFAGTTSTARIASIQAGLPRDVVRGLSPDLRAIVHKATASNPDDRYATAGALADDLQNALEHRPIRARQAGRLQGVARWCRRHPVAAGWLAVTAMAAAFGSLQTASARAAHAAAAVREASVLAAARSLDPWHESTTDHSALARSILLPSNGIDTTAATAQSIAMLQIECGDIEAARREIDAPDAPQDDRTAALRLSCRLLELAADVPLPPDLLAAPIGDGMAHELHKVAENLHRCGRWALLDPFTERLLQRYATERPLRLERRTPLRLLQLRSLAIRRLDVQLIHPLEQESRLLREWFGQASDELSEFEAAYLRTAFEVCTSTMPREAIRARANRAHAAAQSLGDARALRLEAFALGIAYDNSAKSNARLEAVRQEQAQRFGAFHRDPITTMWLLARRLARIDQDQARQLLAEAWQLAERLPPADDELRLDVLRDHLRYGGSAMPLAVRDTLRIESIRLHFAKWGPADPRTMAALFERSWPLPDNHEADAWVQQSIDALTSLPNRIDDLDLARFVRLEAAVHRSQPLAIEAAALALQHGVRALSRHKSQLARICLMRSWLRDQPDTHGEPLVAAAIAAATAWSDRLGEQNPGPGFTTEILTALGDVLCERGWFAAAKCAFDAALANFAAELSATVHDDWVSTASGLPGPPESRRRHLLSGCARVAAAIGDDQARVNLLRLAVAPPSPLASLLGSEAPTLALRTAFADALLESGQLAEAEVQLLSLLADLGDTDARDPTLQHAQRRLHGILVATGRRPR